MTKDKDKDELSPGGDGTEWFATVHTTITDPETIMLILGGMLLEAGFGIMGLPKREIYSNDSETIHITLSESHAVCSNYPDKHDRDRNGSTITIGSCNMEKRDRFVDIIGQNEGRGFRVTALGVANKPDWRELCCYGEPDVAELLRVYGQKMEAHLAKVR